MLKIGKRWLCEAAALYCIGSVVVAQAQDAQLPFTPILTVGSVALQNDSVVANADGSFTLLGNQQGGSFNGGAVWDFTWDLTLNQDPSIIGALTLTNLTTTTRNFNLTFVLPVTPAFSPSMFGGALDAVLIDANGDRSATLAPTAVSPSIYRGQIDGITALSLFALNLTCTGSGPGCVTGSYEDAGFPGLTLAGPGVSSTISTLLSFSLTAGDSVTFHTNFTVEPVPLPAALPLMLGGLALVLRRRKGQLRVAG